MGLVLIGAIVVAAVAAWRTPRPTHLPPARLLAGLRPNPSRLRLGRVGGVELAAEPHHSLLVLGPTQSGKTTAVVAPAVEAWPGPVLVSSVKGDLLAATVAARRRRGEVSVVDPAQATGLAPSTWQLLAPSLTEVGARALARDLCRAGSEGRTSDDGAFWTAAAARHLAPLLLAAAWNGGGVAAALSWVGAVDLTEPLAALRAGGAMRSAGILEASAWKDDRQWSSIATTLEVLLDGFVDLDGGGQPFDVEQFLGGVNTCYLCGTIRGQERSRPVLSALRAAILDAAALRAQRQGGRLEHPLLVVTDEAAHVAELEDLAALAATGVGQGITLLTAFQDLSQVTHHHGALATSIVANHRARLVLGGTVEPTTVDLLTRFAGSEVVPMRRTSGDATRGVDRVERPRLTDGAVRRLGRGRAILAYDTAAPIVVRLHRPPQVRTTVGRWTRRRWASTLVAPGSRGHSSVPPASSSQTG